jgi:hypothetical protein
MYPDPSKKRVFHMDNFYTRNKELKIITNGVAQI